MENINDEENIEKDEENGNNEGSEEEESEQESEEASLDESENSFYESDGGSEECEDYNEGNDDDDDELKQLKNLCRTVISKLRAIIKKCNRSNPLRLHILKLKSEKSVKENFYHDFKIRWNTTYVMLDRSLKSKAVINEITHNSQSIPNLKVLHLFN